MTRSTDPGAGGCNTPRSSVGICSEGGRNPIWRLDVPGLRLSNVSRPAVGDEGLAGTPASEAAGGVFPLRDSVSRVFAAAGLVGLAVGARGGCERQHNEDAGAFQHCRNDTGFSADRADAARRPFSRPGEWAAADHASASSTGQRSPCPPERESSNARMRPAVSASMTPEPTQRASRRSR